MVAISYILSALTAASAVKAAPLAKRDSQSDVIQQTSNDATTVSNELAGLSHQLHSGVPVSDLSIGGILSDVEKLIGDVLKFPTPSHIEQDIADIESIVKEAIGSFTSLGSNYSTFLSDAGTQHFEGSADGVVSGIARTLKGIEGKISGILGFVPKEIQSLISDFLGILEKIPFP